MRAARADEPGARARLWATAVDSLWSIAAALLPERAARSAVVEVRGRFSGLVASVSLSRPWRDGLHAALWEAIAPRLSEPGHRPVSWRARRPEQVHRRVIRAVEEAPPLHRLVWTFALLGEVRAENLAHWSALDEMQVRVRRGEMAWRVACAMRGGSAEHDTGLTSLVCALFGDLPADALHNWSDRIEADPELRALSTALSTAAEACRAALSRVAPESLGWEAGLNAEPPSSRLWLWLVPALALLAIGLGISLSDSPTERAVVPELAEAHVDRVFAGAPNRLEGFLNGSDARELQRHLNSRGVVSRVAELGRKLPKDLQLLGAAPLPDGGAAWLLRASKGEEVALYQFTTPIADMAGSTLVRPGAPTLILATRDETKAVFWDLDGAGFALALRGDQKRALDLAKEMAWAEGL